MQHAESARGQGETQGAWNRTRFRPTRDVSRWGRRGDSLVKACSSPSDVRSRPQSTRQHRPCRSSAVVAHPCWCAPRHGSCLEGRSSTAVAGQLGARCTAWMVRVSLPVTAFRPATSQACISSAPAGVRCRRASRPMEPWRNLRPAEVARTWRFFRAAGAGIPTPWSSSFAIPSWP